MKREMLKNGLIPGIIFLFMGISMIPGINGNIRTIVDISRDADFIIETFFNNPVEEWNKTYGGENRDWFNSGLLLDDGSFVVSGCQDFDQSNRGGDGWLIEIDSEGNMVWDKTIGGYGSDFFNGLLHASDGGYFLGFTTDSFGSGGWDIWVAKTDDNGNMGWNKTFDRLYDESAHCIQNAEDGGYIITGWRHINSDSDLLLSKIDSNGNEEWTRTFGGDEFDYGNDVVQTSDGGYLVIGITDSYGSGNRDGWMIKTDGYGNEEWRMTFGGIYDDSFQKVKKTFDGGFIIVGTKQPNDSDDDIWLLRFDSEWNLEWERVIGDRNYNEKGYSIQQISDDGYIITGNHRSAFITGNQQGIIMKVDSDGYVEWSELFGGPDVDSGRNVYQTIDGGYIVVGETKSYGAGDTDGWVVKFSAFENQQPNRPSRPSGPSSGKVNEEHTYTTLTTDPDDNQIYYMFDWGDDTDSGWLGPYGSGEECSASHTWTSRGNYEIKVKAKDTNDAESDWSDPLPVSMPKNKLLFDSWLDWLLEYFPFLTLFLIDLEVTI